MRNIACTFIFLSICTLAYADLASNLRQLRGVISETANTSKELGSLVNTGETLPLSASAPESAATSTVIKDGDILVGKLRNIKLFKDPSKKVESQGTLTRSEEMIYTITQANGFYFVATANKGDGWVEKVLVKKR